MYVTYVNAEVQKFMPRPDKTILYAELIIHEMFKKIVRIWDKENQILFFIQPYF